MKHPNFAKGCRWGASTFLVAGLLSFGVAAMFSTQPAPHAASLTLFLRPWWNNWDLALAAALPAGLMAGVLAGFRPRD